MKKSDVRKRLQEIKDLLELEWALDKRPAAYDVEHELADIRKAVLSLTQIVELLLEA
jgi:hypothetical protein